MIVIKCKPTSPGRRHKIKIVNPILYKGNSFKSLLKIKKNKSGRNNYGRITVRHRGGGNKKYYRIIDFKRNKLDVPGIVERIEYDPNRSSYIALILYKDGERRYILYPKGLNLGDVVISSNDSSSNIGNSLLISNIPLGLNIHNIEITPGKGGQLIRSAGSFAQLITRDYKNAIIRLRSGELRKINLLCRATIGELGNSEHMLKSLGKAGCTRKLGVRPTVRGTAMNPIDHPHGGGEGRNFGKHPVTPKGFKTKGKKTRKNKRTNKFIVKYRNEK